MEQQIRMHYGQYKQHYADCATVPGSYDKTQRSIVVIVPEGRMKNSGVRGQHYSYFKLWHIYAKDGMPYYCTYRAMSQENAEKQQKKRCQDDDCKPYTVQFTGVIPQGMRYAVALISADNGIKKVDFFEDCRDAIDYAKNLPSTDKEFAELSCDDNNVRIVENIYRYHAARR